MDGGTHGNQAVGIALSGKNTLSLFDTETVD